MGIKGVQLLSTEFQGLLHIKITMWQNFRFTNAQTYTI